MSPPVPSVTVDRVGADAAVVDVREPGEWQAGHIEGALHIPLADLPARTVELPAGTDLLIVCRSGARSARAVVWLGQNGREALNVEGGMQAWAAAGLPMVSETGEAPAVR